MRQPLREPHEELGGNRRRHPTTKRSPGRSTTTRTSGAADRAIASNRAAELVSSAYGERR
jgi:hypothetical protein